MGGGVNLMFHVGSALALVLLVHLVLEFKRQRDLIRELLVVQRRGDARARVYVEAPDAFLARLGKALGIAIEGDSQKGLSPRKIDPKPLFELYLSGGIERLRWAGATLEVSSRGASGTGADWQKKLADALGDGISVKIMGDGK